MKLLCPITFWAGTTGMLAGSLVAVGTFVKIPVPVELFGIFIFLWSMAYIGDREKVLRANSKS